MTCPPFLYQRTRESYKLDSLIFQDVFRNDVS